MGSYLGEFTSGSLHTYTDTLDVLESAVEYVHAHMHVKVISDSGHIRGHMLYADGCLRFSLMNAASCSAGVSKEVQHLYHDYHDSAVSMVRD